MILSSSLNWVDVFPCSLLSNSPLSKAPDARKIGRADSVFVWSIIISAVLSKFPSRLSQQFLSHFLSDPGPKNDQRPQGNLRAYFETSIKFWSHSSVFPFSSHTMSLYIDMKMILLATALEVVPTQVWHLSWRPYPTSCQTSVRIVPRRSPISRLLQSSVESTRHVWAITSFCIRTRWRPLLLRSYISFNTRHASSPLLTSVFFTVTNERPMHNSAKARFSWALCSSKLLHDRCGCDLGIFHRSPAQCFKRLGIRRPQVRSEMKRPLWPILVLTGERRSLTNGSRVHERCCHLRYSCDLLSRVHQSSLCLHQTSASTSDLIWASVIVEIEVLLHYQQFPSRSATTFEKFTSLFTFVRSVLYWSVSLDTDCPSNTKSRGPTILHHNSSPHHNQSRQSSDAARCNMDEMCFHRDTTRAFVSISVHYTLRATAPTEGTQNTYRDFTRNNKKRLWSVRCGQVVRIRATKNWSTTVDCGAGIPVSGNWCTTLWGSKLVIITQHAASKCAFLKRCLDGSENTDSESELNTISKGMGNRFCNVQFCRSSWSWLSSGFPDHVCSLPEFASHRRPYRLSSKFFSSTERAMHRTKPQNCD